VNEITHPAALAALPAVISLFFERVIRMIKNTSITIIIMANTNKESSVIESGIRDVIKAIGKDIIRNKSREKTVSVNWGR